MTLAACLIVAVAAILMGAPSVGGGFLSGDDIQLARDHVLVNRPSLEHAGQLFTILHRDLYQPIAMLSLSMDFAIIRTLGLTPTDASMNSIAWVSHVHNVGLHAINAVLVCLLILRITNQFRVALVAGLVFAVHPLGVEAVAWISGRMMLLSTLFLLLSMLAMCEWQRSSRWRWLVAAILLTALCMMSKVRVCLPVLMLIPMLFSRQKFTKRWWMGWIAITVTTLAFAAINIKASSTMLSSGAEYLQGPAAVRTLLALGWYITHLIVPIGLSPFHPAAQTVSWSHPDIPLAAAAVVVAGICVVASMRTTKVGWLSALWFLSALAVTLPWLPSRNQLVAERYMYLPMVGACWAMGAVVAYLWTMPSLNRKKSARIDAISSTIIAIVFAGCYASWQAIPHYRNDVARSARVLTLYPKHPESATGFAWSQLRSGQYLKAIDTAKSSLQHGEPKIRCEANQIVGVAQLALGDIDAALDALQRATAEDPDNGKAHHRLGIALQQAGRIDEALTSFEKCAQLLPNFNPGLLSLARTHQRQNQPDQARRVYEQIAKNNPYDPIAGAALAEMEMQQGKFQAAQDRLHQVLERFPDHLPARINRGVCLKEMGRIDEAIEQFRLALAIDPDSKLAALGLTQSIIANGDRAQAGQVIQAFLDRHPTDRTMLDLMIRNALASGKPKLAATNVVRAIEKEPTAADLFGKYAWVSALANQWTLARQSATRATNLNKKEAYGNFVLCGVAIQDQDAARGIALAEGLLDDHRLDDAEPFNDFNAVLQACAELQNDNPWPYYILCLSSSRTDRTEMTRLAATEFKKRSQDPVWLAKIDAMVEASNGK